MLRNPNQQESTNKTPWPVINDRSRGDNYAQGETIKVRCIDPRGIYYDFKHRREGDVFELIPQYVTVVDPKTKKPVKENGEFKKRLVAAVDQFSDATMELMESETPVTNTTAQDALNKAQEELDAVKRPQKGRA